MSRSPGEWPGRGQQGGRLGSVLGAVVHDVGQHLPVGDALVGADRASPRRSRPARCRTGTIRSAHAARRPSTVGSGSRSGRGRSSGPSARGASAATRRAGGRGSRRGRVRRWRSSPPTSRRRCRRSASRTFSVAQRSKAKRKRTSAEQPCRGLALAAVAGVAQERRELGRGAGDAEAGRLERGDLGRGRARRRPR